MNARIEYAANKKWSEHDIQKAFFHWIFLHQRTHQQLRYFFAIPNGGYRSKATAGKLRAEGVKSGVPDTCLPMPNAEFHGLYIEFKSATGTLSPEQKDFCSFLRDAGYRVEVLRSWVDAANVTIEYLNLPLEKL